MFCNLRWKRLFCQSAEDPETRVTSMITKRRMFTSRRRKSARKSLPIFSRRAGLPSGLTCFEETCTLLGGSKWNRGGILSKQNKKSSFLHSNSWMRSFLSCFCVRSALIYKHVHPAGSKHSRHFLSSFFAVPHFHWHAIIIWKAKWCFCPNCDYFSWGCTFIL